jgi:hypothetical protein
MIRRKGVRPTDDYSRQASACASAALATSITEIKEAYLNLEQGWLCLAAKGDANRGSALDFSAHRRQSASQVDSRIGRERASLEEEFCR